jgi:molybdopterin-biosynthesis enzyme MoeA-like protein
MKDERVAARSFNQEGNNMAIGAIIIGDEIMRGKRQDKHMAQLISILAARGLTLAWCQYLGDSPELITATLKRSFAGPDIVFSFGGIGATPDDHTRQCAAAAAGVDLVLHPQAEAEIRGRFGADITPNRLRMGEFPRGCSIIVNSYNRIPGFSVGQHHFVPGFPIMAWPMVESVLDGHYAHLFHQQPETEASVIVYESAESTLTPLMEAVEAKYRGLKVFSLPSVGEGGQRRHIELGTRGAPDEVPAALEELKRGVIELGGTWE